MKTLNLDYFKWWIFQKSKLLNLQPPFPYIFQRENTQLDPISLSRASKKWPNQQDNQITNFKITRSSPSRSDRERPSAHTRASLWTTKSATTLRRTRRTCPISTSTASSLWAGKAFTLSTHGHRGPNWKTRRSGRGSRMLTLFLVWRRTFLGSRMCFIIRWTGRSLGKITILISQI